MDKICPFVKASIDPKIITHDYCASRIMTDKWLCCEKSDCAWWSEDARKCAMLVIAESQRKAVKGK